jgi:hypothetical protein
LGRPTRLDDEERPMAFTRCPNCGKVQQVVSALLTKDVGCMDRRCNVTFKAEEYLMHSNAFSKSVFFFVIAFALFSLCRWMWLNATWVFYFFG